MLIGAPSRRRRLFTGWLLLIQVAKDIVEGQCGHSQYGDVVPCTLVEYDYLLAKNKFDENDELDTPGVMTPDAQRSKLRPGLTRCSN